MVRRRSRLGVFELTHTTALRSCSVFGRRPRQRRIQHSRERLKQTRHPERLCINLSSMHDERIDPGVVQLRSIQTRGVASFRMPCTNRASSGR
jgi:hypothetical protein